MKGRRSEVGCCHTVMRGEEGGVAFFIKLVEIIILQFSVLVICTLTIKCSKIKTVLTRKMCQSSSANE